MEMTRDNVKNLMGDIKSIFAELEAKYEVKLGFGNCNYDTQEAKFIINLKNGTEEEFARNNFKRLCKLYGLKEEHYGQEIILNGKKAKIVGIDSKRRKYSMIIEYATGRKLTTVEVVRQALGLEIDAY